MTAWCGKRAIGRARKDRAGQLADTVMAPTSVNLQLDSVRIAKVAQIRVQRHGGGSGAGAD